MKSKLKNAVHGYIALDEVKWEESDWEQFNALKKSYFLEFTEISTKNKRVLYYLCLRDSNLIQDQEIITEDDEGKEATGTKYGILSLFASRNPEIIGVWNKDGTEFGTELSITPAVYDDAGEPLEAQIEEIIGSAVYLFNKELYVSLIEPRIQTDDEGVELSRTEYYDCNNFGGFHKRGF